MCRVQSTPERLPVPSELVPETRREDVKLSLQPRAELHSLVLNLGPFGFQGQVRSLLIKVWRQLQQPRRFYGSHVSHVILGGLYNFIVDNPAGWLLCIED